MKTNQQNIRDVQHFGEEGGVVPVVDVSATSTFLNPNDMEKAFKGELQGCYLYSRHSNPTVKAFGKKLAAMEGMEDILFLRELFMEGATRYFSTFCQRLGLRFPLLT